MKQKSTLLLIGLFFFISHSFAQESLKIGHINYTEIVMKMPEMDSIRKILNKEAEEIENVYNELIEEHEKNVQKYEVEQESYSEFLKNTKQKELIEAAGKIQEFNQEAKQQLQKRNMELMQPVYSKLNDAITRVATRNNFTYILDLSSGSVVFHSANSQNINPLVLDELK
ncbi:OmpH family outer membrane protein [Maribellus maritimus]|uniref:OmpH family outer membrane protein n=1 Tax=Maribellus maritimus TaxID=2870838 RepID=UPI001EEA1752|nr:OmpH family outer membrane protein [Maribellus maritimus]MCG6190906.1 OmpH family outer membrane protein [Maribellus maritimus]